MYRNSPCYRAYHLAQGKKWRVENKERDRDLNYRRMYGITLADYERMFEDQNGLCAICGNPPIKRFHVDHYEINGKKIVRGLLCSKCNTGIGQLQHNPQYLSAAIQYLKLNV